MPAPFELPLVLDNTIMATWASCERKFAWAHGECLHPFELSIDLHAGKCFAGAIETVYRSIYRQGKSREFALGEASVRFNVEWGRFVANKPTPKTRERMWSAVEEYIRRFDPPHDYIEPWGEDPFEFSFALPLTREVWGVDFPLHPTRNEPFLYSGRFDMLGKQEGLIRIRDEKTTTRGGPTFEKQFSLRSQFLGYCAAMRVLGYDVDTVEVRGIIIHKNDIDIIPVQKTYTRHLIDRWVTITAQRVERIIAAWEKNDFEENYADACSSYGGCDYLDLCRSPEPQSWFSSYEHRRWNPLDQTLEELS